MVLPDPISVTKAKCDANCWLTVTWEMNMCEWHERKHSHQILDGRNSFLDSMWKWELEVSLSVESLYALLKDLGPPQSWVNCNLKWISKAVSEGSYRFCVGNRACGHLVRRELWPCNSTETLHSGLVSCSLYTVAYSVSRCLYTEFSHRSFTC